MSQYPETKQLLDHSNFYYIITADMNGNYSYVNNKYKKAFEGIHGEIVGQPHHITIHPDDLSICESVAKLCFENPEKTFPATIRKYDGKGGYIVTQWEYKAMFNKEMQPEGIFCLGFDITEFQNNSSKLESALQSVDEKELILREIAYNQSHIIRKPVANILGLGLVLENMEIDPNLKSLVKMIIESAHELDQSIKIIVDKANDNNEDN
ncbi:MAG: PAS domain-containing protein [Daejeonella sp.]